MMLLQIIAVLFVVGVFSRPEQILQRCGRGQTSVQLGFDDFNIEPYGVLALPYDYKDFTLMRGSDGGYSDPHIPVFNTTGIVMNVSYRVGITDEIAYKVVDWGNGASSPPNVVLTTAESLIIHQTQPKNNRTFVLQALSLMPIYIDRMNMTLFFFNNQVLVHQMSVVNMAIGVRFDLVIDRPVDVHQVKISCTTPGFYTCAHVVYDNIALCYKP